MSISLTRSLMSALTVLLASGIAVAQTAPTARWNDVTNPAFGTCHADGRTDCTPSLLAAARAAIAQYGGVVYLPAQDTALPYLFASDITLPVTNNFWVSILLGGEVSLTSPNGFILESTYELSGWMPGPGSGVQAFGKGPIVRVVTCNRNQSLLIAGKGNIHVANLSFLEAGGCSGNGIVVEADPTTGGQAASIYFDNVHAARDDGDTTGYSWKWSGGFNYSCNRCGFEAANNAGAQAALSLSADASVSHNLPYLLSIRDSIFLFHGIETTTSTAQSGGQSWTFQNILYEGYYDSFWTFDNSRGIGFCNLTFDHVLMADPKGSQTQAFITGTNVGRADINNYCNWLLIASNGNSIAALFNLDGPIQGVTIFGPRTRTQSDGQVLWPVCQPGSVCFDDIAFGGAPPWPPRVLVRPRRRY
jgi:hypothetical protein